MDESCYNFKNNRINSGKCFPAFFADQGTYDLNSNATFNIGNGFLCNDIRAYNGCSAASGNLDRNAGISESGSSELAYIEKSPNCDIVIHASKCDNNPNSYVYKKGQGYRAGIKINARIKVKYFNISHSCVDYNNTLNKRTSTLTGKYETNIYGGVIDINGKFYGCQKTIVLDDCNSNKCHVSKSGNTYTVSAPGVTDPEKDGIYVRKGTPFLSSEYKAGADNLKMFRIYKNSVEIPSSYYARYDNGHEINMSVPKDWNPLYFMVCPGNNCQNPYLCESGEDGPTPKQKDCYTDLEYNFRQVPELVLNYCTNSHSEEFGTDGSLEACLNKCYLPDNSREMQVYRRIDYDKPFPNNRTPGWNWFGRESLINESKIFVKTNNKRPLWVITLSQSDSYNIRNNNRRAGYDVYSELPELDRNPYQIYHSKFLERDLRKVKKHEKS